MEFATGAMGTLIPKLGELLLDEYNLKDTVKKGIRDIKAELEAMQAALVKVSSVPFDQLDPQVRIWANEVRELSYAIEDSLDSSMVRIDGLEPTKPKMKHLLKKARNEFTKFKARHEIANDIKGIESQVRKIKERYDRYKINDIVANPESTTVDPRLSALYNKVSDLVGTDEPIDELMKILSEGAETSQKNLKIVSIVGFGGLGKTTLAKALYDKVSKTYYPQKSFVPVGQNQGAKKVLCDILFELDRELYRAAERLDERQLINQLQEVLAGKRYFIVIDDLWDIQTWETIKCAFVDSHLESTIIVTTRIVDVATKAGGIYHMKPLSEDNSKMLFHTRTCGAEGVSQDNQPREVTNKILKKCGGVPLTIITVASLLVGKPSADWYKVYDAIGFGHEDNEVIQNTRKILSFSYYDLPSHLKACLLYLSVFPEDYFIEKRSLIWRWVVEGFVLDIEGKGSYELGEIYFNKLVNKSMIRLIEPDEDYFESQAGCRVHDMVLDLIRTMSSDINFVTVYDMQQHGTYSLGKRTNRIRRLALHGRSMEQSSSIEMEHLRSFNAFTCSDSKMPLLLSFKVLRVLVIEDCVLSEGHSLEHLGKLVHLRYLGLVQSKVDKLPEGIGYDLKFLQILDVRGYISELPPSIAELTNLRCLWANKGTRMKGAIGKLTCLEELRDISVDMCPNFFTELGKLTNMRVLKIQFDQCDETAGKALAESLCHLHMIQSMEISWIEEPDMVDLYNRESFVHGGSLEDMAPSSRLHLLRLRNIRIPRIPSWIDSSCVPLLAHVWLYVEVVVARDLQALGRLPSLQYLLLLSTEDKCISYTFGGDEFQKLELLATNIEITLGEKALPRLETLEYIASAGRKNNLVPWKNSCPLLEYVICRLDCTDSGHGEVKAAKAVLRKANRSTTYVDIDIFLHNYNRKAARLVDALSLILHGLDRPTGEEITADQRELRRMITSLETLLRDDDDPRVGKYGEQELRGFVTKFRSFLHVDAGTEQDEEPDNNDALYTDDDSIMDSDDDSVMDSDYDSVYTESDDNSYDDDHDGEHDNTKKEEADNDVATSSGSHEEGAVSLP